MRIISAYIDGARRFGRVEGDRVHLFPVDMNPFDALDGEVPTTGEEVAVEALGPLEPPLPVATIRDFITFEQHTAGSMRSVAGGKGAPEAWYEAPAFYFTNPYAAIGSGHEVRIAPGSERFDVELEVAVIIGKDGYNLSVDEAWDHIAGFTILNDWSARDLQSDEMRVGLGPAKGKDTATTLGPVFVSIDELAKYRDGDRFDLTMELRINDKVIGRDSLANMSWSFAELVAYASRGTWVKQSDVIGSGTCGGGCLAEFWGWKGRDAYPPIVPGDTVTMSVDGIGTISNVVVAAAEVHPVPRARTFDWSEPEQPPIA